MGFLEVWKQNLSTLEVIGEQDILVLKRKIVKEVEIVMFVPRYISGENNLELASMLSEKVRKLMGFVSMVVLTGIILLTMFLLVSEVGFH